MVDLQPQPSPHIGTALKAYAEAHRLSTEARAAATETDRARLEIRAEASRMIAEAALRLVKGDAGP